MSFVFFQYLNIFLIITLLTNVISGFRIVVPNSGYASVRFWVLIFLTFMSINRLAVIVEPVWQSELMNSIKHLILVAAALSLLAAIFMIVKYKDI